MRVVMISEEQDSLLNLLKSITEDSAVLQTTDRQQFLLSPLSKRSIRAQLPYYLPVKYYNTSRIGNVV